MPATTKPASNRVRIIVSAAFVCGLVAILTIPGVANSIMRPFGAAPVSHLQELYERAIRFDQEAAGLRPLGRNQEADEHAEAAARYRRHLARRATPYCCMIALLIVLAAAPWFPWRPRYSLRTLLVVTTLTALVLGIIMSGRN